MTNGSPLLKLMAITCGALMIVLFWIAVTQAQVVTAVRDGDDNLKLISWDENGNRLHEAQAGGVSMISAVRLGSNQMVTAVRDDDDNLKVIHWQVRGNGEIERIEGDGQAGKVSRIGVASSPKGDLVVTAVRDGSKKLKVILWSVSLLTGVRRLGHGPLEHDQQHEIEDTDISATFVGPSGTLLATAIADNDDKLKIITWRITPFGCVTKLKEKEAGEVSEISTTAVDDGRLVTAVRDGGNRLKLIAWNVDQDGNISRDREEAQAGTAKNIVAFALFRSRLLTAVEDGSGDLKVIAWNTDTMRRVGEAEAGDVSRIAGCRTSFETEPSLRVRFQTSVRDGSRNLKIIPWRWISSPAGIARLTTEASAGDVSLVSTVCF